MKALVFGKNKTTIEPLAKEAGFEVVENNPEFVVSFGGDGTLMKAEHAWPGVPKIVLKDSLICKKCSALPNKEVLKRVRNGKYSIEELIKLEVMADGKTRTALNDIIVHNKDPRHAIRYSLSVNGRTLGEAIIGDGVVIATPFGSTAYYRSITDSSFELGIGLAFNNSTEQSDHIVLKEDSEIKIKIIRGPAIVYADNQEEEITLEKDSEVTIRKSKEKAQIVVVK